MCPHTPTNKDTTTKGEMLSSYYYICVLMLCMCPRAPIYTGGTTNGGILSASRQLRTQRMMQGMHIFKKKKARP